MTTSSDDLLAAEVIGLLRDIRQQQETGAQKASALERAMLGLNQQFTALDDRRLMMLAIAIWGLAASVLIAGALVAAAITWGIS
jgi:hypothetical protein